MSTAASMKQHRESKGIIGSGGKIDAITKKADMSKKVSDSKSREYVKPQDMARPSSTMHINMDNHKNMSGDGIEVGKAMQMHVTGTVMSHSKDEMGHHVRLNISSIKSKSAPQGIDPHAEK